MNKKYACIIRATSTQCCQEHLDISTTNRAAGACHVDDYRQNSTETRVAARGQMRHPLAVPVVYSYGVASVTVM